jgi:voltage-gated potassium channel
VTITTVGYGDYYPVTTAGRVTAMFIMFMGVGIIGALASILASLLVGGSSPDEEEETPVAASAPQDENELAAIKNELAEIRQMLEKMTAENNGRQQ